MGLVSLGAGVAIGYLIGTKTGRDKVDARIENVKRTAQETWEREDVQDFVSKATDTATKVSHDVAEGAKKAAAAASDAVKKASEKAEEAEEAVADVVDEAEDIVEEKAGEFTSTDHKGTDDWTNEGGAKP
ncbi:YtxH domain-containing protein [Nesterenkonia muleiensis]|uniref:YtxH domain-containing protein n=1 Tax=Nesterenkonia muleiensis TaxID=2282648 RepID=UPI000E739C8F|nr:YtxH domain-containing protein [Nesterenkonia muleiensis]